MRILLSRWSAAALLLASCAVMAGRVVLHNGWELIGEVAIKGDTVTVDAGNGNVLRFSRKDVAQISGTEKYDTEPVAAAAEVTETDTKGEERMTQEAGSNPIVMLKTSEGDIKVELWTDKAPVTVKNFLRYAEEGFYDGTVFHRVIDGFMIQGGGFTKDMSQKETHAPIKNEARTDAPNERGTLAMARTAVVDSATAQFFINLTDNAFLNHKDKSDRGFGYAVFGKVIDGMDVVDKIAKVKTANHGMHQNVPVKPVIIETATVVEPE